ncbi:PcfJ domain-containing protein [Vibrio sp. 10N.286.49.E11]|uniref:PcfJ domain-containing protein n=1 Tax=Vibrio sp. 10N.286.49.E11 TaxID=3229703 RepID=UPI00354DBA82
MKTSLATIPTSSIGYNFDIVICHWSDRLTAYRNYPDGRQDMIEGGIGIGLDFICNEATRDGWLSAIPKPLLAQSEIFPDHQYQMLWLAANSVNAREILNVRPIILAMLCEHYPIDNEQALGLANQGQRKILEQLGLAGTKSALRFIDKLDLTYERAGEIFHVMKLLDARTCHYKRFSHYKKINFSSLSLDNTHPFLTGTRLGQSLENTGYTTRLKLTLCIEDSLRLGQALGVQEPMQNIVRLENNEALVALHDDWVQRHNLARTQSMRPIDANIPYMRCLCKTDKIEQIQDYDDLCKEGAEMRHCIAVYHNRIAQGRYAVFRLFQPERMTIGVSILPGKSFPFEIDQIAGARNKLATESTRKVIFDWLESARKAKIN